PVEPEKQRDLVEGFMAAVTAGDVASLASRLAADAVLWSDGGGLRRAARHPIHGAFNVARFLANVLRRGAAQGGTGRLVKANRDLAVLLELGGGDLRSDGVRDRRRCGDGDPLRDQPREASPPGRRQR